MSAEKNWTSDPPTEKQLDFLRSILVDVRQIKTKGEASAIIDNPSSGIPISLNALLTLRASLRTPRTSDEMHMAAQHWQDKFWSGGYLHPDFKKPIQRQIRQVIESLDAAESGWDLTGPDRFSVKWSGQLEGEADERFLSTLGQMFPELRKTGGRGTSRGTVKAAAQKAQKSGCVVLLCAPFLLLVLWWLK